MGIFDPAHVKQRYFSLRLKNDELVKLQKPCVMGVINMSPNSFFNPIHHLSDALDAVEKMVVSGASIIDVGGEATSPNVVIERDAPSIQEEIDRVVPVIEAISSRFDVLISVDTSQSDVMREAVRCGADMVNDQRALREAGALEAVAELKVPVCLMHFFDSVRKPEHCDLESLLMTIKNDLLQSVERCEDAGISRDRILVDPGFGQGNYRKGCKENYYLLSRLNEFSAMNLPVLIGWSRKSMIGDVLNVPVDKRLYGSIAAATIAAMLGASVIRVHDVKESMDAMLVLQHVAEHF